jgi:CO/xanthine dehydrogenase FAD-binding subunit
VNNYQYARPSSLAEALALLDDPAAHPIGGGTDLAGQVDQKITSPGIVIDLQDAGLDTIADDDTGGVVIGAAVTLAAIATDPVLAPYTAIGTAASLAASPLIRSVATLGGNLAQHTRCWYYRGVEWRCWLGGGDTCYAQVGEHEKHGLQPGDCISAHPSDLAPALAASGATLRIASINGHRAVPLLDLYRRPTAERRSLIALQPGEIIEHAALAAPPDASVYLRVGERQAFSFPLVGVAVARRGSMLRVVASGVANTPVELDPDAPLAELPGNPQTGWKRRVVETLVRRGVELVNA